MRRYDTGLSYQPTGTRERGGDGTSSLRSPSFFQEPLHVNLPPSVITSHKTPFILLERILGKAGYDKLPKDLTGEAARDKVDKFVGIGPRRRETQTKGIRPAGIDITPTMGGSRRHNWTLCFETQQGPSHPSFFVVPFRHLSLLCRPGPHRTRSKHRKCTHSRQDTNRKNETSCYINSMP